ncbi:ATP synthase F1 subunit epsilon [Paraliomyxa miuraensis]|uniref:ATP synthase F1 subunit epsilon n=1 Tax=Paraliomyxa miuraensis TaxID=376150 RepID=UPI00224E2F23|nr:ATP synthase F1 subunit epsilon [Paraliomyxa miuraensis]MCX4239564.1 ATP synthase F1 subunit epsilon [Paraliomyxa miuraensis]
MADRMKLDILTPRGAKREGIDVPGVELPGLLGELGVLPEHVPFVTAVKPGVVRFRQGNESVRLAVGAGFLEVTDAGRVVLLCERALEPGEIDKEAARARLSEVEAELRQYTGPISAATFRDLDQERTWLQAQLRCAD